MPWTERRRCALALIAFVLQFGVVQAHLLHGHHHDHGARTPPPPGVHVVALQGHGHGHHGHGHGHDDHAPLHGPEALHGSGDAHRHEHDHHEGHEHGPGDADHSARDHELALLAIGKRSAALDAALVIFVPAPPGPALPEAPPTDRAATPRNDPVPRTPPPRRRGARAPPMA